MTSGERPTNVRYAVVAVTAVAALWMYIDRVCFSTLSKPVGQDLGVGPADMSWVLGAFFITYALFQIPIGSLADRYGPRLVLTLSIVAWSLCTAATSIAGGLIGLLTVRLALGICEAGAYPAAAGLIRKWASATERGRLSSAVAFGGRIGGAVAPFLTAWAAIELLGDPAAKRANWQGVFLLYGILGLFAAVAFWFVTRDTPTAHPWANAAEAARVPPAAPQPASATTWSSHLLALARSHNMWLFGLTQFFVNIGWAFLITKLPDYLHDRFGVELEDVGKMQTVPLVASCLGMALGGVYADTMYRWLGARMGRAIPIGAVMFLCAITYFVAIELPTAWAVIVALSLMAFLVDLAIPSIWAFAQDVGGRQVGAALGFGNMLGNFGAAASPLVFQFLHTAFGWDGAFAAFAACFVMAGCCGLSLNAQVPVSAPKSDPQAEDYREP